MDSLPGTKRSIQQMDKSLPEEYFAILQTWFSQKTLRQGYKLLQDDALTYFTFQRRFAGMILGNSTIVTVQMGEKKGTLPFVFRDGDCSKCGWQVGGGNCQHIAALALLCLRQHNTSIQTVADLYKKSAWHHIGKFFYEQETVRRDITKQFHSHKHGTLYQCTSKNGLNLQILLGDNAIEELAYFFPAIQKKCSLPEVSNFEKYSTLTDELGKLTRSENERNLNAAGMQSKKQKFESSIWMHLFRLLFLNIPAEKLQIQQAADGLYSLEFATPTSTIFSLKLAKDHTWELLDKLSLPDIATEFERAQQFSRVSFLAGSADIDVVHCCRLQDGTEYTLADIEIHRYGNRYHIDNTLFTLAPIPPGEQLRKKQAKQLSLFGATAGKAKEEQYSFVVVDEDVRDFLKNNHDALHCSRHSVSGDIVNMTIVSTPKELVIDEYEEDKDWCYLAGWYGMGNHKIQLNDLLLAAEDGKNLLPGKTWLDLQNSPLAWFHNLGSSRFDSTSGRIKISRGEFLALSSQIHSVKNQTKPAPDSLAAFFHGKTDTITPKKKSAKHLRSYQRHGCEWLYQLHHFRLGGILADDMGLGKTHQALGLIDLLNEPKSRFLIVCPAAVLYHWPEKQQQFFPKLRLSVYHGPGRDLEHALTKRIIVTSYGVLRQDIELLSKPLFKLALFDEMHTLKNIKTATYSAVKMLNTEKSIGLTGTPVENNVQELATLLGICLPGIFTASPIKQLFKNAEDKKQRQQLQQLVAPFILRRTRKQVLTELPECSEDIRVCELSDDQLGAYREVADEAQSMVGDYLDDDSQTSYTTILAAITRLKQICNHLCQLSKSRDYSLHKSGKWDELTRLLTQCMESNLKVVIFSQFTAMLDIIEQWLTDKKIGFISIRGNVAAKERNKRIKQFNTNKKCKICCASLLAGGTGIDLTGAQVVIHYDRWWNPAKEEQATARVHRMGQKHPVQVYKLITAGTLEEKIHTLIERKRKLAQDLVVEDDASVLKTLRKDELRKLFQL